jgi:hypothetical protein
MLELMLCERSVLDESRIDELLLVLPGL